MTADETATITADVIGVGGALSNGSSAGFSFAGSGAVAVNSIAQHGLGEHLGRSGHDAGRGHR